METWNWLPAIVTGHWLLPLWLGTGKPTLAAWWPRWGRWSSHHDFTSWSVIIFSHHHSPSSILSSSTVWALSSSPSSSLMVIISIIAFSQHHLSPSSLIVIDHASVSSWFHMVLILISFFIIHCHYIFSSYFYIAVQDRDTSSLSITIIADHHLWCIISSIHAIVTSYDYCTVIISHGNHLSFS